MLASLILFSCLRGSSAVSGSFDYQHAAPGPALCIQSLSEYYKDGANCFNVQVKEFEMTWAEWKTNDMQTSSYNLDESGQGVFWFVVPVDTNTKEKKLKYAKNALYALGDVLSLISFAKQKRTPKELNFWYYVDLPLIGILWKFANGFHTYKIGHLPTIFISYEVDKNGRVFKFMGASPISLNDREYKWTYKLEAVYNQFPLKRYDSHVPNFKIAMFEKQNGLGLKDALPFFIFAVWNIEFKKEIYESFVKDLEGWITPP